MHTQKLKEFQATWSLTVRGSLPSPGSTTRVPPPTWCRGRASEECRGWDQSQQYSIESIKLAAVTYCTHKKKNFPQNKLVTHSWHCFEREDIWEQKHKSHNLYTNSKTFSKRQYIVCCDGQNINLYDQCFVRRRPTVLTLDGFTWKNEILCLEVSTCIWFDKVFK